MTFPQNPRAILLHISNKLQSLYHLFPYRFRRKSEIWTRQKKKLFDCSMKINLSKLFPFWKKSSKPNRMMPKCIFIWAFLIWRNPMRSEIKKPSDKPESRREKLLSNQNHSVRPKNCLIRSSPLCRKTEAFKLNFLKFPKPKNLCCRRNCFHSRRL